MTAQLVALLVAVFGVNGAFSAWTLSRAQRRTNDLDNKTEATGQAIDGFDKLVHRLETTIARLEHDNEQLRVDLDAEKKKGRK